MPDTLADSLHANESFSCLFVCILVWVEAETESLNNLLEDSFVLLIGYPLKEFNSCVNINIHEKICDLVLEALILDRISPLVYYIVYYDLTHSGLHAFPFSKDVSIDIISSCLFKEILLVAPLIGL